MMVTNTDDSHTVYRVQKSDEVLTFLFSVKFPFWLLLLLLLLSCQTFDTVKTVYRNTVVWCPEAIKLMAAVLKGGEEAEEKDKR